MPGIELHRSAFLAAVFADDGLLPRDYLFVVLCGVMLGAAVVLVLWSRRTAHWAVTEGRIETVNVSAIRGRGEICTTEISYSYSVAGQFYSGHWTKQFFNEQEAWDFVGPLKGRQVMIHYHPSHPEKSQLAELMS